MHACVCVYMCVCVCVCVCVYVSGPHIPWRPGRQDKLDGSNGPPDGTLPDAAQGGAHIRAIFGRMGFTDQEAVALIGE